MAERSDKAVADALVREHTMRVRDYRPPTGATLLDRVLVVADGEGTKFLDPQSGEELHFEAVSADLRIDAFGVEKAQGHVSGWRLKVDLFAPVAVILAELDQPINLSYYGRSSDEGLRQCEAFVVKPDQPAPRGAIRAWRLAAIESGAAKLSEDLGLGSAFTRALVDSIVRIDLRDLAERRPVITRKDNESEKSSSE